MCNELGCRLDICRVLKGLHITFVIEKKLGIFFFFFSNITYMCGSFENIKFLKSCHYFMLTLFIKILGVIYLKIRHRFGIKNRELDPILPELSDLVNCLSFSITRIRVTSP